MTDKITLLNGGGKPDAMADLRRRIESHWESEIQAMALLAKLKKANFDALVAEGFTPEQALVLIK